MDRPNRRPKDQPTVVEVAGQSPPEVVPALAVWWTDFNSELRAPEDADSARARPTTHHRAAVTAHRVELGHCHLLAAQLPIALGQLYGRWRLGKRGDQVRNHAELLLHSGKQEALVRQCAK